MVMQSTSDGTQAYSLAIGIIRGCWLVFAAIWLVAAVSTKRTVYRETRAQRLRYWIWLVIAYFLLLYGPRMPYPLNLRIVPHVDAYYGTSRLIREIFVRWGLEVDFVDMSDLAAVKKALRPNTKLAWSETPSNPLLKVVDLAALGEIAHDAGAIIACDNTCRFHF